jgi:hypothetical protein
MKRRRKCNNKKKLSGFGTIILKNNGGRVT